MVPNEYKNEIKDKSINSQLFSNLENNIPGILFVVNLETRNIEYINKKGEDYLGHEKSFFFNKGSDLFHKILHPNDYYRQMNHFSECKNLKDDEIKEIEIRFRVKNGRWNWFVVREIPFKRNNNGIVTHTIGLAHDIHFQKKEETRQEEIVNQKLKQSENKYQTVLNSMDEGFVILELLFDEHKKPVDYRFVEGNPAFEKHTGLYNAFGRTAREMVPGLEDHWVEIYGNVALTKKPVSFVQEAKSMINNWFEVNAFPAEMEGDNHVALLFKDVTQQKEAEIKLKRLNEELEKRVKIRTLELEESNEKLKKTIEDLKKTQNELVLAERLSLKGELAHTIAHEVRNPLANIQLTLDILENEFSGKPEIVATLKPLLEIIDKSSKRVEGLIWDLFNVANAGNSAKTVVDLAEIMDNALAQTNDRIFLRKIKIEKKYSSKYFIKANNEKLQVAIVNIIVNALEAMQPGIGLLRVNINNLENEFEVIIEDNGSGMTSDVQKKIFDPYFSQKQSGMGIGLANVKNILINHNARIELISTPGEGTAFKIYFKKFLG
jgi:PAS domain S-box-containing protein